MKFLFSNLFVVTLFVCMSVQYGYCLNCYVCDDIGSLLNIMDAPYPGSECENVDSSMTKSCPDFDDDTVCRTLRADKTQPDGHIFTMVKRSCGKLQFEDIKTMGEERNKKWVFKEGVPVTSTICNTDLCNGALNITSTKLILFISAVLSLSFFINVYY